MNITTGKGKARAYETSWIDRFNDWVARRSIAWVFFLVLGLVLIGVQILFLWLEDGLGEVELLPVIIFNGLFTPFLLALIYILDGQAVTALNAMRSVLDATGSEFDQHEYELSNMPFPRPLVVGLATMALVIIMERVWVVPLRYAALEQLTMFPVVFQIVDKSSAFLFGVFIYHTIRQLRLVNRIYSNHIRIDLFHLGPLRAFSRLTASTAVGLTAGVYGWMLINPELWGDPVIFGFAVIITVLAVSVFVWPLYGVHRRTQAEKESALREIDRLFGTVFSTFQQQFREEDFDAIATLNATISSLEIQHRRIRAIPTWPWRPETVRSALAAIVLPLVLMILQFVVQRALGW